ncbi:proline-rich domain-containing protein [Phocaeicola plebeius]|uniref:proline-rich domain-containing protein n=1 Tax=Phocaeicola plebeius TaxID=310297 RepID=UPI0040296FD1
MRTRTFILCLLALCLSTIRGYASGLGDFRVNARFLTDRMAFELHLNSNQYNDLYEINYDFLCNIGPYVSGIAVADTRAMDAYYRYLDERNDDLRWVLSQAEYVRFIDIEYFFRPIYAINNVCYLRVYKIYPNRTHFYFGPPRHYLTYRGGHCRAHFGGVSYYRRNYPARYHHPVYSRPCRVSPQMRPHDFAGPRPGNRPPQKPNWKPAPRPDRRPVSVGKPNYRPPQHSDHKPQARPPHNTHKSPGFRPQERPTRRPEVSPDKMRPNQIRE